MACSRASRSAKSRSTVLRSSISSSSCWLRARSARLASAIRQPSTRPKVRKLVARNPRTAMVSGNGVRRTPARSGASCTRARRIPNPVSRLATNATSAGTLAAGTPLATSGSSLSMRAIAAPRATAAWIVGAKKTVGSMSATIAGTRSCQETRRSGRPPGPERRSKAGEATSGPRRGSDWTSRRSSPSRVRHSGATKSGRVANGGRGPYHRSPGTLWSSTPRRRARSGSSRCKRLSSRVAAWLAAATASVRVCVWSTVVCQCSRTLTDTVVRSKPTPSAAQGAQRSGDWCCRRSMRTVAKTIDTPVSASKANVARRMGERAGKRSASSEVSWAASRRSPIAPPSVPLTAERQRSGARPLRDGARRASPTRRYALLERTRGNGNEWRGRPSNSPADTKAETTAVPELSGKANRCQP
ncbi:hypothetical protein HRbin27_01371 [bacterium HR27]|nr:hypothetical protein HRbin27_01371 [bacterium HR27]